MTPARAITAGADYLVVGRPVMEAADPRAAADAIVRPRSPRRWARTKKEKANGKGLLDRALDVHNMDGYKEYVAQNGAVFAKYGAKFLVRGGKLCWPGGLVALAQCGA